jgi:hypothetical protein
LEGPLSVWTRFGAKSRYAGRKAIQGADNKIEYEKSDNQPEPQGMVKVKEVQRTEQSKDFGAEAPGKLDSLFALRNQRSENGCNSQNDQEYDGELDGTEETPDDIGAFV